MIKPTQPCWIDTHCHLNYQPLKDTLPDVIANAKEASVGLFVCIGTKLDEIEAMQEVIKPYPESIFYTIGHHPCQRDLTGAQVYERLDEFLNKSLDNDKQLVGLGEAGLDITNPDLTLQKEVFHAHLELCSKYDLPLSVHSRDMDTELLASLTEHPNATGVLHCWTGSKQAAYKAVDMGWKISFSGILTFAKKAEHLQELAADLPLESIVIETDAPFLAPHPYRGKTNEPKLMVETAKKLAALRSMHLEDLKEHLFKNSLELYKRILSSQSCF